MSFKVFIYTLFSFIGSVALSNQVRADTTFIQVMKDKKIIADVVRIDDLAKLKLVLNDSKGRPFKKFSTVQKQRKQCQISFAMNAGMYHANFAPVGLYIEKSKQLMELNQQKNQFGNFFLQPNGVVAWDDHQVIITTTDQYTKTKFNPQYATQSGPMLVINGSINPSFIKSSDSLKIRNGVGVKNNQLYFVISRGRINFYDFANIFKTQLKIDQALYLDGSISSAYIPQAKRHDQIFDLGPMFIYDELGNCAD